MPVEPGTFYANYFRPALGAVGLPASAPAQPERTEEDGAVTPATPAVRGVRLHDLRHSFAVISLSAGAHYMAVSKWLGHESYVTTLTIYAKARKLHQMGVKPQVSWPAGSRSGGRRQWLKVADLTI